MSKRTVNTRKLDDAIEVLKSLIDEFDVDDREEMKARVDVLTTLLLDTGLIRRSPDDYLLNLDYAVKALSGKSRTMASTVEEFYAVLSSYDDDPDSMQEAFALLETFGPILIQDLEAAKKKWSKQTT